MHKYTIYFSSGNIYIIYSHFSAMQTQITLFPSCQTPQILMLHCVAAPLLGRWHMIRFSCLWT